MYFFFLKKKKGVLPVSLLPAFAESKVLPLSFFLAFPLPFEPPHALAPVLPCPISSKSAIKQTFDSSHNCRAFQKTGFCGWEQRELKASPAYQESEEQWKKRSRQDFHFSFQVPPVFQKLPHIWQKGGPYQSFKGSLKAAPNLLGLFSLFLPPSKH